MWKGGNAKVQMEQTEVISILKNRDMLLLDCEQRRQQQMQELQKLGEQNALSDMYRQSLKNIDEEENKIRFVWFYFLQLPRDFRVLLEELYVKQAGWDNVLKQFTGSKSKLCKQKNAALSQIIECMDKEVRK